MAAAGMDRRRVYDFLDEEMARKAAAEASPVIRGGVVVDVASESQHDGASGHSIQEGGCGEDAEPNAPDPHERATFIQHAIRRMECASSDMSTSASAGSTIQTLVSIRPLWKEKEGPHCGTASDRGEPQFQCLTWRPGKVQVHAEARGLGGISLITRKHLEAAGDHESEQSCLATEVFPCDKVFGAEEDNGKASIDQYIAATAGLSSSMCVVLHGQTGAGKTYNALRIQRRIAEQMFASMETDGKVRVSYVELNHSGKLVELVQDGKAIECANLPDLLNKLHYAEVHRSSSETSLHELSSRSHAICKLEKLSSESQVHSSATIVDLAGNERSLDSFQNRDTNMQETKFINSSLSTLQECVKTLKANALAAITKNKQPALVPYRNSKLTSLLKDVFMSQSLGSQSTVKDTPDMQVFWISHLAPMSWDAAYTRRTLQVAKTIKEAGKLRAAAAVVQAGKRGGSKPPLLWNSGDIRSWISMVEGGKFEHLAEFFGNGYLNGSSLKHEWKYDLAHKVKIAGGSQEEGEQIYELFHARLADGPAT